MTCKHENADHLMPGEMYERWHHGDKGPTLYAALVEQFRCCDCCAWLSLGPSNDSPPEVRAEIRAAEIATTLDESWLSTSIDMSEVEHGGWRAAVLRRVIFGSGPSFDAGFLARVIHDHEEPSNG